ncbi:MAG: hypothetical protein ACRCW2_16120, partial [Cellulosilyticaceae bacterium]
LSSGWYLITFNVGIIYSSLISFLFWEAPYLNFYKINAVRKTNPPYKIKIFISKNNETSLG